MTLEELYRNTTNELKKAGADSPAFDAVWLLDAVLNIQRQDILAKGDTPVSKAECEKVSALAKRRTEGEPLQYILGHWEFFGRKFHVGEGVLIPRDDTEVVLCSAFAHLDRISKSRPPRILDLCSGSGIIAITLKCRYPDSHVTAVEISDLAVPYLRKNAQENNAEIHIIHGDIFEVSEDFENESFDLVISNPPYVRSFEMRELQREVRFEPTLALDGGEDGCDFYRRIVPMYTPKIRKGGMLAFELDADEAELVGKLMTLQGFENIHIFDDLGGVHRAINGTVRNI